MEGFTEKLEKLLLEHALYEQDLADMAMSEYNSWVDAHEKEVDNG